MLKCVLLVIRFITFTEIMPQQYRPEITKRIGEAPHATHVSNNPEAEITRLLRLSVHCGLCP